MEKLRASKFIAQNPVPTSVSDVRSYLHPAKRNHMRGTSIVELLVSMLLSTMVLTIVARDFGYYVHSRADMDLLAETQQAANSSITFLTQELRQAGACLPELGNFISLDGEDNGTLDSITLRIGIADDLTLQCNRTIVKKRALKNQPLVKVEASHRFEPGQWLYMIKASGHGNFFRVASVSGQWLTLESNLDKNYGRGSGVYALEERTYTVEQSGNDSVLTVSVDGSDPEPMARGIESLDIQYKMAPCPPCNVVDEPSSDDQWRVVREVVLSIVARSSRPGKGGEYLRIENSSTVKPRNFL